MGQFQNVQRGDLFMWFLATLVFAIITMFRLIQNQIDFKPGEQNIEQPYRQGQIPHRAPASQVGLTFVHQVIRKADPAQDDSVLERWCKKVHQYEVYFMPILFPFALNMMTGTTYSFLFVMFFISAILFLIFNTLKIHRYCVDNRVLITICQISGYAVSFLMLLNIWIVNPNLTPYVLVQRT